jgi:glycosyltransferase involved in cell wall biosynthesis
MHSNPKVTVAIPVYNTEPYVAKCLNSVFNQDYNNIEILITYDISSDNSLQTTIDVLKNSVYPYRIIEKKEEEKGLGKARNIILDNFQGDYLFFLDCDDYIEPSTISLLVKEAIANDADIVGASHRSVDEAGNIITLFQYDSKRIFDNRMLRHHIYVENGYYAVYAWNKLYKSSFLKENNIRCIHNIIDDAAFSFSVVKNNNKIVLLPEITLNYLIRSSSITNAVMYRDLSIATAINFLDIRDYIYSSNIGSNDLITTCSNVDAFAFGYISTVRNSFKSKSIPYHDKIKLCRSAFITPDIPLKNFFKLLNSKKRSLIMLLVVKILPFRVNMLLVKLYHKIK